MAATSTAGERREHLALAAVRSYLLASLTCGLAATALLLSGQPGVGGGFVGEGGDFAVGGGGRDDGRYGLAGA